MLQRVYRNRGIQSASELDLGLARLLPPEGLLGIVPAAELLANALVDNQAITIVGDFDADGATSTALALGALRDMGATRLNYLVPNRFEFGYGLTPEIVALAAKDRPDLIITVDNGISSLEGVAAANELGIATLVTDHHLAGSELPAAAAIVNPNQPGCDFPSKHLAGVGVIFYLMLALRKTLRERDWFTERELTEPNPSGPNPAGPNPAEPNLAQYLDLVALGTVADVVPLDRNNRILVAGGLQRIRAGHARPGILALLEVAGKNPQSLVASDLGFIVGPRLNAAGRLDDMSVGIECLRSEDVHQARPLAERLHQFNRDRRVIEQNMQKEALDALEDLQLDAADALPLGITLFEPGWHQGVVGILASRIKDKFHRPTIAFAEGEGSDIKGSARSIPGVHIRDVLDAIATRHPGLISKFGGHAMAAGLSLAREDFAAFSRAFIAELERHADDLQLQAILDSDGALEEGDFNLDAATALRFGGPWGQHFPEPAFDGVFGIVQQRLVGEKHLKLVLALPGSGEIIDAIAFNVDLQQWPNDSIEQVDAVYRLDVNEFRGRKSVQLIVEQLTVEQLKIAP